MQNKPQLTAEMKYVHIDWKDMYKDELAQELADERAKVIAEVEQALDGLDCGFCNYGDEVKLRLSELRAKLVEMKEV